MEEVIQYPTQCELCETHKSELGVLLSIKESIRKNFVEYSSAEHIQMIICWFNNYKLDERTRYISQQKKDTTAQIQKYKKDNIKEINK